MQYVFSQHTYPDEPERWLQPPVGKYLDIINCAMEPSDGIKQIDLCCGLGFGKTLLAITIAVLKLQHIKGAKILFLEPDWDRVRTIFLDTWEEHVPPELYRHEVGRRKIIWLPTGNELHYRARIITGSRAAAQNKRRGVEYTDVIDDETADGFDLVQYQNTFARIRKPSPCKTYITLTTPMLGAYGRFIKRGGNILFRGRTADNHYLLARQPDYETKLRAVMSKQQALRELDGELVALEGRLWNEAVWEEWNPDKPDTSCAWPHGNRHDEFTCFDPNKPWWLFCDLGGATGAYVVVQKTDARYRGQLLFNDPVWVAVADYCPINDASADRAFQVMDKHFGTPFAVVAGQDHNAKDKGSGRTMAYYAKTTWGNVRILPCSEHDEDRQLQYDLLTFMMCSAVGNQRRFTVARDFVSLEPDSHRGVREMILEDAWPAEDKIRAGDVLPKNREITVQHTRDALLMGTMMVMRPPRWLKTGLHAA